MGQEGGNGSVNQATDPASVEFGEVLTQMVGLYPEDREGRERRVRVLWRGRLAGAHGFRVHPLGQVLGEGSYKARSDGDDRQQRGRHDGRCSTT